MFSSLNSFLGRKPAQKSGPAFVEPPPQMAYRRREEPAAQSFTKVFRWRLPDGQTEAPGIVEIVGSFTRWEKVVLQRDSALDSWHATIHHIQNNRTHHYMLLIDGVPTYDRACDGYAVPANAQEAEYQLQTERGPRVLMLFSRTK